VTPAVALRLGRVSNLPTVWTNALAGVALAGASPWRWATLAVAGGLSLAYVGGMYLNDAFDRATDAREQPFRPIPSGAVEANTVFAAGFLLLLGGIALLLAAAGGFGVPSGGVAASGFALAGCVVVYSWHHKDNPLSPLVMGTCRLLSYVAAGVAATAVPSGALPIAAAVALCYLIGLTFAAKREASGRFGGAWPLVLLLVPLVYGAWHADGAAVWLSLAALAGLIGVAAWLLRRRRQGDIGRAVGSMIAGIALLDAMFLAVAGRPGAAALALGCFVVTLVLQRWVRGT